MVPVRMEGAVNIKVNSTAGRTRAIAIAFAALGMACMRLEPEVVGETSQKSTYHATDANGAIVLRDAGGNPITQGSTTPYSPEKTCGTCHDTSIVTRGYHFQQGRTGSDNNLLVSDSYNPTKPWLLSPGMYGKT